MLNTNLAALSLDGKRFFYENMLRRAKKLDYKPVSYTHLDVYKRQIPNRQAICEVLMDKAKEDKDIMVLCSDSRGSASMTPFADNFPDQFIETGIAEMCIRDRV